MIISVICIAVSSLKENIAGGGFHILVKAQPKHVTQIISMMYYFVFILIPKAIILKSICGLAQLTGSQFVAYKTIKAPFPYYSNKTIFDKLSFRHLKKNEVVF